MLSGEDPAVGLAGASDGLPEVLLDGEQGCGDAAASSGGAVDENGCSVSEGVLELGGEVGLPCVEVRGAEGHEAKTG